MIALFPQELIKQIFSYLDETSLCRASVLSKRWHFLSQEAFRKFYLKEYPQPPPSLSKWSWKRLYVERKKIQNNIRKSRFKYTSLSSMKPPLSLMWVNLIRRETCPIQTHFGDNYPYNNLLTFKLNNFERVIFDATSSLIMAFNPLRPQAISLHRFDKTPSIEFRVAPIDQLFNYLLKGVILGDNDFLIPSYTKYKEVSVNRYVEKEVTSLTTVKTEQIFRLAVSQPYLILQYTQKNIHVLHLQTKETLFVLEHFEPIQFFKVYNFTLHTLSGKDLYQTWDLETGEILFSSQYRNIPPRYLSMSYMTQVVDRKRVVYQGRSKDIHGTVDIAGADSKIEKIFKTIWADHFLFFVYATKKLTDFKIGVYDIEKGRISLKIELSFKIPPNLIYHQGKLACLMTDQEGAIFDFTGDTLFEKEASPDCWGCGSSLQSGGAYLSN